MIGIIIILVIIFVVYLFSKGKKNVPPPRKHHVTGSQNKMPTVVKVTKTQNVNYPETKIIAEPVVIPSRNIQTPKKEKEVSILQDEPIIDSVNSANYMFKGDSESVEFKNKLVNEIFNNLKMSSPVQAPPVREEDAVIDITNKSYSLAPDTKDSNKVPYWQHHYVYSRDEINHATSEQRAFYSHFKENFLKGNCLNLEGNTNYAFILFFDLIQDLEKHKSMDLLETQLELLGRQYTVTDTYARSYVNKAKRTISGYQQPNDRMPLEVHASANYSDQNYWQVGGKFKKELNLNESETEMLNLLWDQTNNFCGIRFCYIQTLKLFLLAIRKLEKELQKEGMTFGECVTKVSDLIARKQYRYRTGSENYKYIIRSSQTHIHNHLFKLCENAVREIYGHKRRVNTDITFTIASEPITEFNSLIASTFNNLLIELAPTVQPPDEPTETELNTQNPTRWKIKFDELASGYTGDFSLFYEDILLLGKQNDKNPAVENIFFDASKFIAKSDKPTALRLYVHYLHYDLRSVKFDNKQFTKTIQKSLFSNSEQLHDFETIISQFIKDKNIDHALHEVGNLYVAKRKKITLNTELINEVNQKHSGTLTLLNEYLKDEEEVNESTTEEVILKIDSHDDVPVMSIYAPEIQLNIVQQETLSLFRKNNYSIQQDELELYAKSKGIFKNQLIENINDRCFELLDDVLIEEDEDYFTINENNHQKILAL